MKAFKFESFTRITDRRNFAQAEFCLFLCLEYVKNDIPACALAGGLGDETGKAAKIKAPVDFPAEKYYNNKANLQPGA